MNQHFFIKIIQYKKTQNLENFVGFTFIMYTDLSLHNKWFKTPFTSFPPPPTGSRDPNISSGYSVLTYLILRKTLKYVINSVLLYNCLYT